LLRIRQDQAVLRSPTVTLRFFKAPPPLLRLPTELRLQILGYLLISFTPIPNPYVDRHRGPEEKRPVFVDARILRTCRRIYIEGWPVLYQKNTFRFTEKAALDSFRSSKFWNHKEGLRHLELQTTVAERYCHRTVRIQGQMVQHMRVRGPAGWDWPFSPPWHFSHLHTLKLELKDFQLLPVMRPVRTRHFKPDPETKEGRDALLSRQAVIKHIEENCKMPKLQDLTVVGVPESMGLLLFEINLLMQTLFLIMGDNQHHRESVCYLEKRPGGRWERQDDKTILEWEILQQLLSIRREELAPSGHQRSERSEKYLAKLRRDLDLGVLMWIRRRNAKRLGDKAVAGKEPSPLW